MNSRDAKKRAYGLVQGLIDDALANDRSYPDDMPGADVVRLEEAMRDIGDEMGRRHKGVRKGAETSRRPLTVEHQAKVLSESAKALMRAMGRSGGNLASAYVKRDTARALSRAGLAYLTRSGSVSFTPVGRQVHAVLIDEEGN